jgi:hypothetical protein
MRGEFLEKLKAVEEGKKGEEAIKGFSSQRH